MFLTIPRAGRRSSMDSTNLLTITCRDCGRETQWHVVGDGDWERIRAWHNDHMRTRHGREFGRDEP